MKQLSVRLYVFFKDVGVSLLWIVWMLFRAIGEGKAVVAVRLFLARFQDSIVGLRAGLEAGLMIPVEARRDRQIERLRKTAGGLHGLLPRDARFSYSILIPVYRPQPLFFEKAVVSALEQTAPDFEVLLGFDGEQPNEVVAVVKKLQAEHSQGRFLKVIQCDRSASGGGISRTTNALAQAASKNFFLLMDHDDWIRPDLLYRYELTLRLQKNAEMTVLYCDEYKIDERDAELACSRLVKPLVPPFPYVFINFICHCLMIPRAAWEKVGGLRPECDGSQDFDFCLRLDQAGFSFVNIPILLYAWRAHSESTAKDLNAKDYATASGIRALEDYFRSKNLSWSVEQGYFPTTYRAIPPLPEKRSVAAVILFKDLPDLTLRCVKHLQNQKIAGVASGDSWLQIVAVDNGSQDLALGEVLKKMGVTVLRKEEAFNYSRLSNTGVREGVREGTENILFLNNDVFLDEGAVEEMLRWVDQPKVGVVGCRLMYPSSQRLQHGGVQLDDTRGKGRVMNWRHTERGLDFEDLSWAKVIQVTDAVTAACCMMKKSVFEEVGGFDEVYYPIGFSDIHLCTELEARGYYSLYTPYAHGVHCESVSRGQHNIEDFESSSWLKRRVLEVRGLPLVEYLYGVKGYRHFTE